MTTARTLGRVAHSSASSLNVSLWRIPRTRSLLAMGTIAAVSAAVAIAAHVYTDFLWFKEVGQEQVYWTSLKWNVLVRLTIGFGAATFLLANLAFVDRSVAALARQGEAPVPTRLWAYRNLLFPLAAIVAGISANHWAAGGVWQSLMMWMNRGDFGVADPLFHRDVGFFVFSLPLYQHVAHWLYMMVMMAGAAVVAAYVAAGAIRISQPRLITRAARTHLLALAALLLVLMAWRYRLDQFALVLQHEGAVVPGATYTDVHVLLPTLRALMLISVAGAVLCLYAAWRPVSLPLAAAATVVIALLVVSAGARGALPNLVQRLAVEPQALSRERPYVSDSIAFTRRAFQLDRVGVRPISGRAKLSPQLVAENKSTLDNVPLWDASVLQPAMDELQSIGTYYNFPSTTVDVYKIGGRKRFLTLGARQLDLAGVKPDGRSWANERFAYTHGYGVVATQAQQIDGQQQPGFAQGELRGRSNPLGLHEPRIYYGERPDSDPPYMGLRTSRGEVEEPAPGAPQRDGYHYGGDGGIQVSSPLRRFAFAVRFGDPKLLLTQTLSPRSRIMLHRDARERLATLAPFIGWDASAQTAVLDGHVKFMFHGYTTSSHYPYSASVRLGSRRFNYVRAAALGVVDAFTGQTTMYATDPADPILRAWRGAYPSLFHPAAEMSRQLQAHVRYPARLFAAQAQAYATYHVDDPARFWTSEDAWQRSLQLAGPVEQAGEINFPDPANSIDPDQKGAQGQGVVRWQMRSGYQFARLPGDTRERFMLATPFTPRDRQNLAGYLAGSMDQRGRPRLTLVRLPQDRLTIGPTQATRRILADTGVSKRLDLVNRESRDLGKNSVSRTVLGVPRLVPVGDALVHVQPFYLVAGENGVPRLQLVTVHVNGHVGYGRDLSAALRRAMRPASSN
jgi:uncharacterized protein